MPGFPSAIWVTRKAMPVSPKRDTSRMLGCAGMSTGMTPTPDFPSTAGRNRIQLSGYRINRKALIGWLAIAVRREDFGVAAVISSTLLV